jgi:hypothetical protein
LPALTTGTVRLSRLAPDDSVLWQANVWGRAGDWVLENDSVQFILSSRGGSNGYVGYPGGLLDAFRKEDGRRVAFDSLDEYWPLINGAPILPDDVEVSTPAESTADVVTLGFSGKPVPVPIELAVAGATPELIPVRGRITYRLAGNARALEITSEVENVGLEAVQVELGDFVQFGDDAAEAMTLPAGFEHGSPLTQVDAVGSVAETDAWAALVFGEAKLDLVRGSSVAAQLGGGDTGLVRYDVERATLAPGERVSARRWFGLGRDVAEALGGRRIEASTVHVTGHVSAGRTNVAGASVSFFTDAALTELAAQALSRADGGFELELAPGAYFSVASARGNGEYVHVPGRARFTSTGYLDTGVELVQVALEDPPELELALLAPGSLRVTLTDSRGQPSVAKLVFQRSEALPPPRISVGERQPYSALGVAEIDWVLDGSLDLKLPHGQYTVTASAGPRRGLAVARDVTIDATPRSLSLQLPDPVGPTGYWAIDSHLHGTDSQHGEVTREERLVTALAEGLDVAVSTDHDKIVDYGPVARALGVEHALVTIPSVELTHRGHHNLWPLSYDAERPNGGAIRWWFDDPGIERLYAEYRKRGARVVQVNHGARYFHDAGYDPGSGQVAPGADFSFAFNAMELHNGKGTGGREDLIPIWFSLLDWGRRIAPLAVSDSHHRIPEVGSGRTYVWLSSAVRATPESIADAVVQLRSVASTGPLIELTLASGEPALGGDVALPMGSSLALDIRVWAPDWIPIELVRLYANGEAIQDWNGTTAPAVSAAVGAEGLWFEARISVRPAADTWYVVEASGSRDLAPVSPGLSIWSMTAPVFVDADGTPGFTARNRARRAAP